MEILDTWKDVFWKEIQHLDLKRRFVPDALLLSSSKNFKPRTGDYGTMIERGSLLKQGVADFKDRNTGPRDVTVLIEDITDHEDQGATSDDH